MFDSMKHKREDGGVYWVASEVLKVMGYDNPEEGEKLVQKAMELRGNVGTETDFIAFANKADGEAEASRDYCLSKKACRMLAGAADGKKPGVYEARVYFAQKRSKDSLAWKIVLGILIMIPVIWLVLMCVFAMKESKVEKKKEENRKADEQLAEEALAAGYTLVIDDRQPEDVTIDGAEYYEAKAPSGRDYASVLFRKDAAYRMGSSGNGYESLNPNYRAELYCKEVAMQDETHMLVEPYCLIRPEKSGVNENAVNSLLYSVLFLFLEIAAGVVFFFVNKNTPYTYSE
ncbi:MAG: hypothetical protein J5531_02095 [Lachnospiraceae bacterium]|nr:hypothetical protein [Lachnospiraceae bacterium]